MTDKPVTVTQADRDAAWLKRSTACLNNSRDDWDAGRWDHLNIIRAEVKHRTDHAPSQPDYSDEISPQQMDAIRNLAGGRNNAPSHPRAKIKLTEQQSELLHDALVDSLTDFKMPSQHSELADQLETMRERCTDPCRSEKAELGCDCDAARQAAAAIRALAAQQFGH